MNTKPTPGHEKAEACATLGDSRRPPGFARPRRRPWVTPRLVDHGDVRELTLGATPGIGESGNPTVFRV